METPTFKELLKADVHNIFLNPAEFGERHRVNGKIMVIVLDDMEHIEREKKMKSNMDGIYARQVLFYVAADDFGPLPGQDSYLNLDGAAFKVVDATDECGIYAITLEANRSR